MRMEVHVHGTVHLRPGVRLAEINEALHPWLEYLDVDTIAEVKSIHHDEPGILFDPRGRVLDICWSGDVGRSFGNRVEPAVRALSPLSEVAAEIEVSYYDDDGNDETNIIFVGPTPASIHEAQRRRMTEDVSDLLARHFDELAISEVVLLVNELFARDWAKRGQTSAEDFSVGDTMPPAGRRHLH
jgi:phenylpyruvate tautomerase PptA (4-oxalocrotonate tautomerase family)